jgi:iron complex transport system ATP-binding protein
MDEPTTFLDLRHQVAIYDLLKTIQIDKARTVIAITQDINLAAQYCDQALLLRPLRLAPTPTLSNDASHDRCQYRIGPASEVLSAAHVQTDFGVDGFSGRIGKESFFIPLGRMAKDADRNADQ